MERESVSKDSNRFFPGARGLRDAAETFERFFNLVPDPACLLSSDGLIKAANSAWETTLGYRPEDLSETWLTEILHPEDVAPALSALSKHLTGSTRSSFLSRCRSKYGDYRWLEWQATACTDAKWLFATGRDVTARTRSEELRAVSLKIISRINQEGNLRDLISDLLYILKNFSGCSAVGLRLKNGDDYPYYQTMGFPNEHVESENRLCQVDEKGQTLKDSAGNPILECMCGNILAGRYDPHKPFFTCGGSFWSNCTTNLLASTTDAGRQTHTRNRCNGEGYESVALIPLKTPAGRIIGLIQLNDTQTNCFSLEMISSFEELAKSIALVIERKQDEILLREREEHLRLATRGAALGTFSYDFATARGYGSPELEALLAISGYTAFEPLKFLADEGYDPDDWDSFFRDQASAGSQNGEGIFELERKINLADRSVRWLRTSGRVEFSGEGNHRRPKSAAGVVVDITKSKLAEEALRKSEAKFSQLFNIVQVPMTICDLQDMKLVEVNDAFLKSSGLTRQEVIGYPAAIPDWRNQGDSSEFANGMRRHGKVKDAETVVKNRTGEDRTILLSAEIVNLGGQNYLLSSSADITERKNMEKSLAASEQKYRALFEEMVSGFALHEIVLDDDGIPIDYITIEVNREYEKLLDTSRDVVVGKRAYQAVPGLDREWIELFGRVILTGQPRRYTQYASNLDKWFEGQAFRVSPKHFAVTFIEITERKKAEQKLKESEILFRTVADYTYDWEYWLAPDGSFNYVTPSCQRVTGYSREEFLQNPDLLIEIVHQEDRKKVVHHLENRHSKITSLDFRITTRSGALRWINHRCQPIFGPEGQWLGQRANNRDITERINIGKDLVRSQERLSEFTLYLQEAIENEKRSLSHEIHDELGQLLTGLKIDLDWLNRRLPPELEALKQKTKSMSSIIDQAEKVVKMITANLRPVLLDDLGLVEALKWLVAQFSDRTGVKSRLKINPEYLVLDNKRSLDVYRVVQEVLTNVTRHASATLVSLNLSLSKGRLHLLIKDNGVGLTIENVNDPHSFGLIGIKERVRRWKGIVEIKGVAGKGTSVEITIPVDGENND